MASRDIHENKAIGSTRPMTHVESRPAHIPLICVDKLHTKISMSQA